MGWTVLRLAAAFGAASLFVSAAHAASYPAMAPVDQYMMDRTAEIALAKSAAPPSISDKATILMLTPHGYETAVKGSNGFVCAVERGWMSQYEFPEFWNPHVRGPLCFNPPAVRTILPYTIRRTELVLAGRSKSEMSAAIKRGIEKHMLPPLEAGALTFMLSKHQYLNDKGPHWMPHLMFYFPRGEAAAMKTRTIAGLLAAPLLFAAAPAHAMSARAGATTPVAAPSHSLRRHEAILAVRDEARALQDADGGTLTQSHRAYLQAKLDAVRDGIY